MKKITLLLLLAISFQSYSQSLQDVFKKYLQPDSDTKALREGLTKVDALCATTPHPKCNKVKATGYYLLANQQYALAYTNRKDKTAFKQYLNAAQTLFKTAAGYMPITDFTNAQKFTILEQKFKLESDPDYKAI